MEGVACYFAGCTVPATLLVELRIVGGDAAAFERSTADATSS